MMYTTVGIILIIVAIVGGVFTIKSRKNMPTSIFGLTKEQYDVIDKENFNKVMGIQAITLCFFVLLAGVLLISFKDPSYFLVPALSIFVEMIFSKIAKRYIRVK